MILHLFILMLHPPADDDIDQRGNEDQAHRPSEVRHFASQVISNGDIVIEAHIHDVHDYGADQEEDVQFGDARIVRRQVDDVDVEMNAWKYAGEMMTRATFARSLLHGPSVVGLLVASRCLFPFRDEKRSRDNGSLAVRVLSRRKTTHLSAHGANGERIDWSRSTLENRLVTVSKY